VIVLDASVLLAAEDADDVNHRAARGLLGSGRPLATVDLAGYEVNNVAEARWRDAIAGERLRERFWLLARYGTLVRIDRTLLDLAEKLMREHGLSAYDAAYLAAARQLDAPLVSCDERDLVGPGLAQLPGDV
jgi:predicted nucleic acid-binding protein